MIVYDLPIPIEENFLNLCIDLLTAMKPKNTYHKFGINGQNQFGIDIIADGEFTVYQCKWRGINKNDISKRKELIQTIDEDLLKIKKGLTIKYDKIVFISTHYNDALIQTHVKQISEKEGIHVDYWGWDTVQGLIQNSEQIMQKYYSRYRNIRQLAVDGANYLGKYCFSAHRGAILLCPGKTAVFGNDGFGRGKEPANAGEKRARAEVAKVRSKLKKLGITELSFGLCNDSYTWVLLVESSETRMLNDEIWDCYSPGGSNNKDQKAVAYVKLSEYFDEPLYQNV